MEVRRLFVGFFRSINSLLYRPTRILWVCAFLIAINMIADGSLFRLWGLYRDNGRLEQSIDLLKTRSSELRSRLQKAREPSFLEKEARDRFDLVSEGDLVFVFTDEQEFDDKN